MLLVNTIGSLIAPAIIALVMDIGGIHYLFISFVVISMYYAALLAKDLFINKRSKDARSI